MSSTANAELEGPRWSGSGPGSAGVGTSRSCWRRVSDRAAAATTAKTRLSAGAVVVLQPRDGSGWPEACRSRVPRLAKTERRFPAVQAATGRGAVNDLVPPRVLLGNLVPQLESAAAKYSPDDRAVGVDRFAVRSSRPATHKLRGSKIGTCWRGRRRPGALTARPSPSRRVVSMLGRR